MKKQYKWALGLIILLAASFTLGRHSRAIDVQTIATAEELLGLNFNAKNNAKRQLMLPGLQELQQDYQAIRKAAPPNEVLPALHFMPNPQGFMPNTKQQKIEWQDFPDLKRPQNLEALAFFSLPQLSYLVRTKQVSSTELTNMYLQRLKRFNDTLQCAITITEALALEQAAQADADLAAGRYRGPLHGIPYGIKDLFAVPGYKTTWGATPYKNQVLDYEATVAKRLRQAGAVLLAKLSVGALAWGDVWFGGTTKNPWNMRQGSSGSSAGSASATAAGLVGFSIGTETLGSIVSPSTRCGVTGLRPTFGRVSRYGAMALSWSMDKAGPICRSAQGCAMVFSAIHGYDENDPMSRTAAFNYVPNTPMKQLKVGYFANLFSTQSPQYKADSAVLATFKKMGATPVALELPSNVPVGALGIILNAEAAAAFDNLTISGQDSLLVRQIRYAWPNFFRTARFVPAVEYVQANRLRTLLQQEMHRIMQQVDVVITPTYAGNQLLITNLTGHPAVSVPNGFSQNGSPTSITLLGNLYDEANLLAAASLYQNATGFDEQHPAYFKP